ncbi:MAG: bifunctional phosphopantothenoylcysteine decarboxylase/phosphopantothenate--cysteine ligase CoaBC [Candidatus Sumerlaeia bacterium]
MNMNALKGRRVLLGISGGIAAYKAVDLCRRIIKAGGQVRVIMTRAACEFVTPLTLETLSGNAVYRDMFDAERAWEIEHISFARWGDVLVVAPATANSIAKMACGLADDPLSTTALAFRGPVLVVPAMNTAMWDHPQTRENLEKLRQRGVRITAPAAGMLACGEEGAGKLADVEQIMDDLFAIFNDAPLPQSLDGKRVMVTAGPTVEAIDPVRYLSNPSSGRMGFALAAEAQRRGARVTLIHGPVSIDPPRSLVQTISVRSAGEMNDAVQSLLAEQDICIFSAAVADYTPANPADRKMKKEEGAESLSLELKRTPDIAAEANKRRAKGQLFVGFAAETNDVEANARAKMEKKGFDIVVANEVSERNPAFAAEDNQLLLLSRKGERKELPRQSKVSLATPVWDFIENTME